MSALSWTAELRQKLLNPFAASPCHQDLALPRGSGSSPRCARCRCLPVLRIANPFAEREGGSSPALRKEPRPSGPRGRAGGDGAARLSITLVPGCRSGHRPLRCRQVAAPAALMCAGQASGAARRHANRPEAAKLC